MAQEVNNQATGSKRLKDNPIVKWVVILLIAVLATILIYFVFIKKDTKDIAESNLVYHDESGAVMPVCNLSPTTAYAASTFNPTHASQLSMAKCKSTVAKQCRTLPFGNPRTVCKTELTKCVCSKNGGK